MEQAQHFSYEDLREGMTQERAYVITPEVYQHFLAAFDDRSPLHVELGHARRAGFTDKVMHGTILNGFLSHFVGMVFPGARSLLLGAELRYSQPCYLGDSLMLSARIAQKVDTQNVVVLHVRLYNGTRDVLAATGRAQVKVRAV